MVSSNTIAGQTQLKQWCIPNQLYDFTTQQSQALPSGYDIESGFGRIDAGNSLDLIEFPNYRVVHYEAQGSQAVQVGSLHHIDMVGDYDIYPAGPQWLEAWKYTVTVNHNLPSGAQIVSSFGKPGYWVRNSGSNLWGPIVNGEVLPETNIQFVGTPTEQSATLVGYYYREIFVPNEPVTIPYTADPNKPEYETPTFAYSLLIYDPTPTAVEDISQDHGVKIYPNPTTNLVTVGVNLPETNSIKIEMLDMLGRRVNAMVPGKKGAGIYRFQMNTSHLAAGMYVMKISIGEETITKKVQVQ